MTDLISRADAIDALSRSSVYAWSTEQDLVAHSWAIRILQSLPSADAVSREVYHNLLMASNDIDRALREYQAKEETDVAQGEWVDWLGNGNEWECSVCKCSVESHGSIAYNYCPMCGARMKGESHDG